MITREEAKDKVINYALGLKVNDGINTIEELIDQIYNYHEAQLKAKDEEIKELGEIVQQYLIPSKNYDAIIKAKDDEIERLKEHITHLQNVYMKLDGKYLKLKTELEELKDNI